MTPPELNVEAWLSLQNAYLASKALKRREGAEAAEAQPEPPPLPEEPRTTPEELWQDWFGIWR